MPRLPIYKKCTHCDGKGQIEVDQFVITPNGEANYQYFKTCIKCKGKGKLKTNYFVEYKFWDIL